MSQAWASSNRPPYDDSDDSDADDFMKTLESARYNRTNAITSGYGGGVSVSDADSDAELFNAMASNRSDADDIPALLDDKSLPPPPPPVDDFDSDSDDADDFNEYQSRRTAVKSGARLLSPTNSGFHFDSGTSSPSGSTPTSRMNDRVGSMFPRMVKPSSPVSPSGPDPPSFHRSENASAPPPPPAMEDYDEDNFVESKSAQSHKVSKVKEVKESKEKTRTSSSTSRSGPNSAAASLKSDSSLSEGSAGGPRTFANSMYTSFESASHQVEHGLYLVKRTIAFTRKLVHLEEERHKGIQKMLHHELTKAEKISQDGMSGVIQVLKSTKQLFGEISEQHKNIAEAVSVKVLHPLSDFYEKADAKLREINLEEHKMSKEMATARSIVTKHQKECLKLHLQIRIVMEEKAAAAAPQIDTEKKSFFSKMKQQIKVAALADPRRLMEQLAIQAKLYLEAVRMANERQQRYVTKDLPTIFDGLEKIEIQRISAIKERLHKLHKIYVKVQSPLLSIVQQMETVTGPLKYEDEIKGYLDNFVYIHGEPNPLHSFNYLLPCSPEDLMNGKLEGSPNSVFKTTLQHIMTLQKDSHPELEIPRILRILVDSVRDLGGFSIEGIFRVSHQKDELAVMRKSFDTGECKICTTSPHGPAALMKEWLRDLSESLVPSELYSDAVKIVKTAAMTEEDSVLRIRTLDIFRRLDDVNRHVIKEIAVMCSEIASPKNQLTNRMTMDNLAIVFAPSFLRNPSEDPMELLNNTKHEIRFTSLFLSAVAEDDTITVGGHGNDSLSRLPSAAPSMQTQAQPSSLPRDESFGNSSGFFQAATPANSNLPHMSLSASSSGNFPPPPPANSNPVSPFAQASSVPATPNNGSSFFTPAPSNPNPFLSPSSAPPTPGGAGSTSPTPLSMPMSTSASLSSPSGNVSIPMRAAILPPPSLPARPTSYSLSARPPPPVPGSDGTISSGTNSANNSFASPTNNGRL